MAYRLPVTHARYASRLKTLQAYFAGDLSKESATESIASTSLSAPELGQGLAHSWEIILISARENAQYQDKLVDLLVHLSGLPPAKDKEGEQLKQHGMRVWADLPTLGWEFNSEWNNLEIPSDGKNGCQDVIAQFINVNAFAARLASNKALPNLSLSILALWTMRPTLETPIIQLSSQDPLEAFLPAAAAWIKIAGACIYVWREVFPHGHLVGSPGRGGPLWNSEHGFSKERWSLWKRRFGELASSAAVADELRTTAKEAESTMTEIESQT